MKLSINSIMLSKEVCFMGIDTHHQQSHDFLDKSTVPQSPINQKSIQHSYCSINNTYNYLLYIQHIDYFLNLESNFQDIGRYYLKL